jgi:hypothetical protein
VSDLALATKMTEALVRNGARWAWLYAARAAPELPWATALESLPEALIKHDDKLKLLEQL